MSDSRRKVALVTGGSGRLGAKIVDLMASKGFDVAIHSHSSVERAQELSRAMSDMYNVRCGVFQLNLNELDAIDDWMSGVFSAMGGVDVLVNNASLFPLSSPMLNKKFLLDSFNVNFFAPVLLTKCFASQVSKGGVVINIIDGGVTRASFKNSAEYFLAQKSLAEFTISSQGMFGDAVRINGICPDFIAPFMGMREKFILENQTKYLPSVCGVRHIRDIICHIMSSEVRGQLFFVNRH